MIRSLTLCCFAVACAAAAQTPSKTGANTKDDKFVAGAMSGGAYEVQASKLAMQRASNPEVKRIAEKLIADHTKCNQELANIVNRGQPAPAHEPLAPIHAAMLHKLTSEQGADFDECFLCQQLLAHEEAVMCFRKEAKMGHDPQLRAFADKTLPTLREHLRLVRKNCEYANDDGRHETLKPGEK